MRMHDSTDAILTALGVHHSLGSLPHCSKSQFLYQCKSNGDPQTMLIVCDSICPHSRLAKP